jgi:hypothetical protein
VAGLKDQKLKAISNNRNQAMEQVARNKSAAPPPDPWKKYNERVIVLTTPNVGLIASDTYHLDAPEKGFPENLNLHVLNVYRGDGTTPLFQAEAAGEKKWSIKYFAPLAAGGYAEPMEVAMVSIDESGKLHYEWRGIQRKFNTKEDSIGCSPFEFLRDCILVLDDSEGRYHDLRLKSEQELSRQSLDGFSAAGALAEDGVSIPLPIATVKNQLLNVKIEAKWNGTQPIVHSLTIPENGQGLTCLAWHENFLANAGSKRDLKLETAHLRLDFGLVDGPKGKKRMEAHSFIAWGQALPRLPQKRDPETKKELPLSNISINKMAAEKKRWLDTKNKNFFQNHPNPEVNKYVQAGTSELREMLIQRHLRLQGKSPAMTIFINDCKAWAKKKDTFKEAEALRYFYDSLELVANATKAALEISSPRINRRYDRHPRDPGKDYYVDVFLK